MSDQGDDTQRPHVDVHVGVGIEVPAAQERKELLDDPDLEEEAARMFMTMPPAPATIEEAYRYLMIRSIVNKLSIMRVHTYFDKALALIRQMAAKTEERVAHTERQLDGVQRQLVDIRLGQQEILSIARNIDSTRAVEMRFNGQIYQRLEERLMEEADKREQAIKIDRFRMYAGWAIFAGIMFLGLSILMWSPVLR